MLTVLRNSGALLRHSFSVDGVATSADAAVTVTVLKADGTAIATAAATTHDSSAHSYSYTLAPLATLNLLTVTWTGSFGGVVMSQTDQVEITGGVYVSLSELRAMPGLSDTTAYSNEQLADTRREFEDLAERYCGVAFVPRFCRETLRGTGHTSVLLGNTLPRVILAASATDTAGTVTAFTTTNWHSLDYGALVTDGDTLTAPVYGERNLTVEYEHGYDTPPPGIVKACKLWVHNQVLQDASSYGRDVLSQTDPAGFSTRYSTPDWEAGRPTGIFDVDRALTAIGRKAPSVA